MTGPRFFGPLAVAALAFPALAADLDQCRAADAAPRPNLVLILADDLGFSDLGCYGSEIATPHLDRLAREGLRFRQFYNAARCCPTRAALLTGLYPHQAGVGHMLETWRDPAYTSGLSPRAVCLAESLRSAGYRSYHVGKWHVGGVGGAEPGTNHPLNRGFDQAYGTGGGGSYFDPKPLYFNLEQVRPGPGFYATDAFADQAARFIEEHARDHAGVPFFLHLCFTAPHFPLHALPEDIPRYRGRYQGGWDALRAGRLARQKELGLFSNAVELSPRDPIAAAWEDVAPGDRDEWDLRMAVHAAMVDRLDQGVGRVLAALDRAGVSRHTLVLFLSDNGASAEFLDSWPNPARGHRPGSQVGTPESHRCLEVGWANAANTPFREHKMWIHEGGIATPAVAWWPEGISDVGRWTDQVGHVIDVVPTFLELAGAAHPDQFEGRDTIPLAGTSLAGILSGGRELKRTLGWEHEGNRGWRDGDWKLVAAFRGEWELYNLTADRSERRNLAHEETDRVASMSAAWQAWADVVGVVPWQELPGSDYVPSAGYRKKSEPPQ